VLTAGWLLLLRAWFPCGSILSLGFTTHQLCLMEKEIAGKFALEIYGTVGTWSSLAELMLHY
jgi:hypothetical protein